MLLNFLRTLKPQIPVLGSRVAERRLPFSRSRVFPADLISNISYSSNVLSGKIILESERRDQGEGLSGGNPVDESVFPLKGLDSNSSQVVASNLETDESDGNKVAGTSGDTRPKYMSRGKLLAAHRAREIPELKEEDLEETFVRGSGPGGQAINKTSSSVSLIHRPTGIRIQCQATRSREQNRKIARKIMLEKLDQIANPGLSKQQVQNEKERQKKRQKAKKVRKKARLNAGPNSAEGLDGAA